jgi:3-oxoacyl-(acyl-carrier-protein) synthase
MSPIADSRPVGIQACGCLTPFGDAASTLAALLDGRRALRPVPVLGTDGGDRVPLAVIDSDEMAETLPPRWMPTLRALAAAIPPYPWGSPRHPVVVTSSNFGVGSLYAFLGSRDPAHLAYGAPFACTETIQHEFAWGGQVHILSHACVSAHVGLLHASRLLLAGMADRVLVFTFDFVSPFVAGGFHSLKILNAGMPAPFEARAEGSIGLGDGAGFAVLTREPTPFRIEAQALHNEMRHFTGNVPDGSGFSVCADAIAAAAAGRRLWVKGHGTGTLDAGRLEAEAYARVLPGAPLVSWKGSLGHTLGSCGLVELAVAIGAMEGARAPGTVGTHGPCFTDTVALAPFPTGGCEGVVIASNAFGGAHAALLLGHA